MRLKVSFVTILFTLILKIMALNFFEKALILRDYPLCATVCSGRVAKKLSVNYFDGRGNCARPDYQYQWKQCVKKACFHRDRRKVS